MNKEDMEALVGMSVLAAASRTVLLEEGRTFWRFTRACVLAAFVGAGTALMLDGQGLSPAYQGVIVGISAFVADYILSIIINVAKAISEKPVSTIINIILRR